MTKILHISDWHGDWMKAERKIDEGALRSESPDILLVTGDMVIDRWLGPRTAVRSEEGMKQIAEWYAMVDVFDASFPGADIIAVPGNHCFFDYYIPNRVESFDKFEGRTFSIGNLKFTGFRGVPWFNGYWDGEFSDRTVDMMVQDLDWSADIVLTHCPPFGILDAVNPDRCIGHKGLHNWFVNHPWHKRRIHAFGHVHECGGRFANRYDVTFSNAAGGWNILNLER